MLVFAGTALVSCQKNGDGFGNRKQGENEQQDNPDDAFKQNARITRDPITGTVPNQRKYAAAQAVSNFMSAPNSPIMAGMQTSVPIDMQWWEVGPKNVGGRTRGLWADLSAPDKLWAGGVGGGLWYSPNASSSSPVWYKTNDFFDNLAVTAIAQNPTDKKYMYFGTGEGFINADAIQGFGIWRSDNTGGTWTRVTGSDTYPFIQKIVVASNGHVFAATRNAGIIRSTDNGLTFSTIVGNNIGGVAEKSVADIEIAANGTIYATFGFYEAAALPINDYVGKIIKSTTNGSTWTACGTTGFATATTTDKIGRIEIACAPSDANTLYAFAAKETFNGFGALVSVGIWGIYKSTNGGTNWAACQTPIDVDDDTAPSNCGGFGTIPPTDFTRGQAWYDMALVVAPNSASTVFVGGIDLFKSTNSGSSWTQISKWQSCINCPGCSTAHADQHAMTFKPNNTSILYFANDGGISRTVAAGASLPTIISINNFYNVSQYYSCAIHPTAQVIFGGLQDNGTQQHASFGFSNTTAFEGGDGGFCFMDTDSPNDVIGSYTNLSHYHKNSITGSITYFPLPVATQTNYWSSEQFINPCDYDSGNNILYAAAYHLKPTVPPAAPGTVFDFDVLARWTNSLSASPTFSPITLPTAIWQGRSVSAIKAVPTTPTTVFIGSGQSGFAGNVLPKLLKINNANTATPTFTDFSCPSWVSGSTISCIEIDPANQNHLIVTFSNYGTGMQNVWEGTISAGGSITWVALDSGTNLPDIPVRWALFAPTSTPPQVPPVNSTQLLIATEVGVWSTQSISGSTTNWGPSNTGLANVRVDMLKTRADKIIVAATHGRGVFYTDAFSDARLGFHANITTWCTNQAISFYTDCAGSPLPTNIQWDLQSDGIFDALTNNTDNLPNQCGYGSHITLRANFANGTSRSITRLNYLKKSILPCTGSGCSIGKSEEEQAIEAAIKIYPNPADGYINISIGNTPQAYYQLYDLQGSVVKQGLLTERNNQLPSNDMAAGMYFIKLLDNQQQAISVQKIIVNH